MLQINQKYNNVFWSSCKCHFMYQSLIKYVHYTIQYMVQIIIIEQTKFQNV